MLRAVFNDSAIPWIFPQVNSMDMSGLELGETGDVRSIQRAINHLEAQYGKKVDANTADQLIGYLNDLVASLP